MSEIHANADHDPDWIIESAARPIMQSRIPAAPEGVVLRVPVIDPASGEQKIDNYERPLWREYTCRVVYAGNLDDLHVWQVVSDRWMHPGDQVVAQYVPSHSVLIGPPPAVTGAAQEAVHV